MTEVYEGRSKPEKDYEEGLEEDVERVEEEIHRRRSE